MRNEAVYPGEKRLKVAIDAMYGIDFDITILQDDTYDALNSLADMLDRQGKALGVDGGGTASGSPSGNNGVGEQAALPVA